MPGRVLTDIEREFADPPKKVPITIRIYPALLERIKRIAKREGMPYQTLINQWLAERVYFEERKLEEEKR